jgi:hypothetical protein
MMGHSLRRRGTWAALVLLAGCSGSSTQVTNAWHAPGLQPIRFTKTLAACICREESTRRSIEDQLAKRVPGGVTGYSLMPEEVVRDTAQAKERLRADGFDGVVVMRLVGVERQQTYVPGSTYMVPAGYNNMWGYWGVGYGAVYSPGYVDESKVVSFETNVYTVGDGRLVWASRSATYDPSSISQVVNQVVDATVAQMKKDGVIAQ